MNIVLLGTAQDGGVPQAGCACERCAAARRDPARRHMVVCLGVIDRSARQSWIIDATPDFREQLQLLHEAAPECALAGIWLTHMHMGHYTGLLQLGKEAMATQSLPVHASARACAFLRANEPWAALMRDGYVDLREIAPDLAYPLAGGSITAYQVPHRAEYSDTFAYSLRGASNTGGVYYCPDIDDWKQWRRDIHAVVAAHDTALLDGSFFADGELARDMRAIPHPRVTDTVARLRDLPGKALFIHINHSNPLLTPGSQQLRWLRAQGFDVGALGMNWTLG